MGDREKVGEDKDSWWEKEIDTLVSLGNELDDPAPERYWERDAQTGEILWKPSKRDVWIQENLKIRPKVGSPMAFKLNRVQREYSRVCREKHAKHNIVLKARQIGMTSYIAARFFVQTIVRKGSLTMLVAHNRDAAEEIFRIVHRFWNNLDEKLQTGPLKKSHSSSRELVFPRIDCEFTVMSADDNAGRGRTIQNLHCTEVSRWGREGTEALAALRAAVVPNGEIVLESTANGAWGHFYEEWQQAEETGFTRHFFPWWFEESYVMDPGPSILLYTEEESALVKEHGLTRQQIAWRRQQWSSLRGLAAQEFAEDAVTCFKASGDCVFDVESIEAALKTASAGVETEEKGHLEIWMPPEPKRKYVIGVDPAGGGMEGDYSCAEVIDQESGMQCAELHGRFPLREFGQMLVRLGQKYNGAELAVERNNHGGTLLVHLASYPHVFKQAGQEGWLTSAQSRPRMIGYMEEGLAVAPNCFRSARLLNECRTFVRDRDGRPGGAPGTHDDCVMAMAIAWAVRADLAGQKKEDSRS